MMDQLEKIKNTVPPEQQDEAKIQLLAKKINYLTQPMLADLEQGWGDPKKVFLSVVRCLQNGVNIMHIGKYTYLLSNRVALLSFSINRQIGLPRCQRSFFALSVLTVCFVLSFPTHNFPAPPPPPRPLRRGPVQPETLRTSWWQGPG